MKNMVEVLLSETIDVSVLIALHLLDNQLW